MCIPVLIAKIYSILNTFFYILLYQIGSISAVFISDIHYYKQKKSTLLSAFAFFIIKATIYAMILYKVNLLYKII
uniref:Uncharacterized protein n=1 Tax=Myoviridae sp. ctZgq1 TaxID=2826666 RepID=A0A8S5LXA8_9CAUD|nr:MAG TPA: hypothetical protein [Myoviridae sp. ctZgq1]